MQQLVQEHRYDGTLCWIGAGMEEHGYRYGFRSNSCTKEEMVVRMQGEEPVSYTHLMAEDVKIM